MKLRVSAEHAGWSIREAAWGLEERVLWRGSDATQEALQRAGQTIAPLQKLIQTRLTWPLSDAYRARGRKAQAAIAASTAALALATGAAGVITAPHHPTAETAASTPVPTPVPPAPPLPTLVLQGTTPKFQSGHARVAPQPQPKPSKPAAQVAWDFAQAFVGYEVGRSGDQTEQVFADTATKPLAKTIASDPPRLPAAGTVAPARAVQ